MFEVGDIVVREKNSCNSACENKEYTVFWGNPKNELNKLVLCIGDDKKNTCTCQNEWTLIRKNNNKSILMNIKEKFVLALTKEPQKSFRKAGITNGDDILTDEGTKVFLSWLLHKKYADEFKTEVVNELLKKEEE
jgi:hypothetical protein